VYAVRLAAREDNEACLVWLNSALARAFKDGKPGLWDYLEAVMEEVLFEIERGVRAHRLRKSRAAVNRVIHPSA
jgi:hypothetical protein